MRRISTAATAARHERGSPGNGHYTDTHTHALDLLRDALGATVIATYPTARAPLPDTGPCARCGATTTRYGPHGPHPYAPAADRPAAPYRKRPRPVTLVLHQVIPGDPQDEFWIQDACHATLRPVTESATLAPKPLGGVVDPV